MFPDKTGKPRRATARHRAPPRVADHNDNLARGFHLYSSGLNICYHSTFLEEYGPPPLP